MANTTDTVLDLKEFSTGYSGVPAVQNLNIRVGAGEIVALLGPNGAGKSTTVLGISGVLPPFTGTIAFNGTVLRGAAHKRARAGMGVVLEGRQIFRALTVEENLRLGLGPVKEAVSIFPELEALLDRKAGVLSGGEQQMMILGRTLAGSPSLLVVDELSLGLAPVIVNRLFSAFREAASRGVAVLVVEQHAQMTLEMADRAYVLGQGRVRYDGPAMKLLEEDGLLEKTYFST